MQRIAAWSVAAVVAVVHGLVAARYGFFRNELYFIVCGRHPAFGYVDQPPLVPLLAALTQAGGPDLWLLRIPAVLSAIALVPLTVALASLLGASARGAWLAAVAAAASPLVIAMSADLSTSTFEPLAFTAIAYFVVRAIVRGDGRAYWWAGVVAGLAFEAKYGALLWLAGIVAGLLLAGPRSALRSRDFWIGAAIAALVALPNVIWQIAHGLPFLDVVRNDNAGNLIGGPVEYAVTQIFVNNIVLAPLWIAALAGAFVSQRLRGGRFIAIAFVVTIGLVFATHGKMYYTAGAYPAIFALGAAACTRLPVAVVALWSLLTAANGALALPYVLPVLRPVALRHLIATSKFSPRPVEAAAIGAPLMEPFSDEFGWRQLADIVERAYAALPPAQRASTAIYAENYGEASAIAFFGQGLPPVISANNQYYLWGPRGYDGSSVLAVNVDPALWSTFCRSAAVVARTGDLPFAMPYERDRPIVLCRGMHPPLAQLWPRLRAYGLQDLSLTWRGAGVSGAGR